MKARRHFVLVLAEVVAVGLCVVAEGCKPFEVPCSVVAWGSMFVTREGSRSEHKANERFTNLDWMSSSNTPAIAVRMPDGVFLSTDQMRKQTFDPYLASGRARVGEGWDIIVSYSRAEARIVFGEDGNLKRLQVWSRDDDAHQNGGVGTSPAIQPLGVEKVLTFPLSKPDLIEAFGKPTQDTTWRLST